MNELDSSQLFKLNQDLLIEVINNLVNKLVESKFHEFKKDLSSNYYFDDSLITREELADKLNVSIGTIDNLRARGKITGMSVGKSVRFKNSEILEYIKNLKPC
jgi:excisionase family DNA binding protein